MPPLECNVFNHDESIEPDALNDFTVSGGSEKVLEVIKEKGIWDGASPNTAAGLHINSKGDVTQSEIFLMGVKDGIKLDACVLWGGERHNKD